MNEKSTMPNGLEGLSPAAQAAAGTFESPARFTREMAEESRHVVGDTVLREAKPRGRPRKAAGERKEAVSIRLSPEVLAHFRAGGEGWQTRMDEVLRRYVAASLVRDLVGPADEVAQGLEVHWFGEEQNPSGHRMTYDVLGERILTQPAGMTIVGRTTTGEAVSVPVKEGRIRGERAPGARRKDRERLA